MDPYHGRYTPPSDYYSYFDPMEELKDADD